MTNEGKPADQPSNGLLELLFGSVRLDSFRNALTNLGVTDVDQNTATEVAPLRLLDEYHASELYRGNLYAQKSVDELVEETLGASWTVTHPQYEDLNKDRLSIEKKLKFARKFDMAAKLARSEANAWLWIVTDDVHNEDITTADPLDLDGAFDILQVQVLERAELVPVKWQANPEADDFGEPLLYSQSIQTQGGSVSGQYIHRSRLIELSGKKLSRCKRIENGGYDDSVYQAGYEQLKNGSVIEQVIAKLVNEAKITIAKLNHKPNILSTESVMNFLRAKMSVINRHKSVHNMVLLDKDEELVQTQIQWNGLDKIKEKSNEGLSAFSSMPLVKLFGMTPAGMSTDDRASARNWNSRQERYFNNDIVSFLEYWYIVLTAAQNGPTGGQCLKDVSIEAGEYDKPTATEQADYYKSIAEYDAMLVALGVPRHVLLKHRFGSGEFNPAPPTLSDEVMQLIMEGGNGDH